MPLPPRPPRAGQSLVEYALILAVVVVIAIPAISFARAAFVTAYLNQQAALQSAPGGPRQAATRTPVPVVVVVVPTDADDCKDGGWQSVTRADGTVFTNQGDCVSYVHNGK